MKAPLPAILVAILLPLAGWNAARGLWLAAIILGIGGIAELAGLTVTALDREGGRP